MATLYNQYIYKDGAWRQIGVSSDSVTYNLSVLGNALSLIGSDGSVSSVNVSGCDYVEGTQSSVTSTWTGVSTYSSLNKGQLLIYHLPYTGSSSVPTLNLTLSDGTTSGAKTVGTKPGTNYAAGTNMVLVYNGTSWQVVVGGKMTWNDLSGL